MSVAKNGAETASEEHPRVLIPELLRQMYRLGWVSGTGGGMSVRVGEEVWVAPSGVQKERVKGEDLFVQSLEGTDLQLPKNASLKKSQCTPLFMKAYTLRGAGAVIHTHSKWANLVTMMAEGSEFRISNQEMIKGIRDQQTGRALRNDQTLVVPIIDNSCFEKDLVNSLEDAIRTYPSTCAVLVRNHGVYVWGDTWEQAKSMCECYDYLFELACEMKRMGIESRC